MVGGRREWRPPALLTAVPGMRTDLVKDEVIVVGVCGVGRCSAAAEVVVDCLQGPVRDAPSAILVRTTGCVRRGSCRHADGALVVVQRCDEALSPRAPASELVASDPALYVRVVRSWLRGHRFIRRR